MARRPTSRYLRKRFLAGEKELGSGRPAVTRGSVVGEDFIRILTKLTKDLERFDSMVVDQRRTIEPGADDLGLADEQFGSQTTQLRAGAEDVLASARHALRLLSEAAGPHVRSS